MCPVNGVTEYPMLLKHGEDLRQDERILQLLSTVDLALVRDTESRKRRLRIRTFQVDVVVFNLYFVLVFIFFVLFTN